MNTEGDVQTSEQFYISHMSHMSVDDDQVVTYGDDVCPRNPGTTSMTTFAESVEIPRRRHRDIGAVPRGPGE